MDLKGAWIRNIYNVCSDGNETKESCKLRVNIPHYQRPYKWGKMHIEKLFEDYFKAKATKNSDENSDAYFVGSIVLVKKKEENQPENRNREYYDVVDGQQRITTVFLLNYVKFLILRSCVEEQIIYKKRYGMDSDLKKLETCYTELIGDKKIRNISDKIGDILRKMEDDDTSAEEEIFETVIEEYHNIMLLPEKDFNDMEDYNEKYVNNMQDFWEEENLSLRYNRESYNKKLKIALSKCYIKMTNELNPQLEIICKKEEDKIVLQYTKAVQYIFNEVKCRVKEEKPLKFANQMINIIDNMLVSLEFCVIITGNNNDAFTLFEVLNDRAYALDDLELVKNLFFKKYCDSVSGSEKEEKIDKHIEELDEIWGERIFEQGLRDKVLNLTAYLGSVYLTANTELVTRKQQKYREIIDNDYLKYYDNVSKKYEYENIKNDFMIFEFLRILIEEFGLRRNNANENSIKAECSGTKSVTYRTMHLLNAFGYDAIMPAITNIIIKTFVEKSKKENDKLLNPDKFREYVKRIANDKENKIEEFQDIHRCSFTVWKMSLITEKPDNFVRAYARDIIAGINNKRYDGSCIGKLSVTEKDLKSELIKWTEKWKYGNKKENHRVRVLLIDLLRTQKDKNKLRYSMLQQRPETEKLELDHLEADNIDQSNKEKYFTPKDEAEMRDGYTNSLGNIMILDKNNNIKKGNEALYDALPYYNKMGSHWMINEIQDMIVDSSYSKTIQIGEKQYWIPTEKFFNERKRNLQKYFYAILTRDIHDEEAKIVELDI